MKHFEIVAHRGIPTHAPENTIASFQQAVDQGADAIELDVRLTADQIPVIYHYFYLEETTSSSRAIFDYTFEQLREVKVVSKNNPAAKTGRIPTLSEIIETFGGKIGLEIEIKGPEPEAPDIIGSILNNYEHLWGTIEITSYQPALLLKIKEICPGLVTDLLFPRSQNWMKFDVVQHQALHLSRLSLARAVHLHPTQLSKSMVSELRSKGLEIHAWDVNHQQSLKIVSELGIPRICTDNFEKASRFRAELLKNSVIIDKKRFQQKG